MAKFCDFKFVFFTDANSRRPSADFLSSHAGGIVIEALREIKSEHGEEKRRFLDGVLDSVERRPNDFNEFTSILSEPFLRSLTSPSNLLFPNQYQEQLVFH